MAGKTLWLIINCLAPKVLPALKPVIPSILNIDFSKRQQPCSNICNINYYFYSINYRLDGVQRLVKSLGGYPVTATHGCRGPEGNLFSDFSL